MVDGAPNEQGGQQRQEVQDAEKVDEAIHIFLKGRDKRAEDLLKSVLVNTPEPYVNEFSMEDGALAIKFWSQQEFVWYVLHQHQGKDRNLSWVPNAYPRAHYYLGVIAVKAKRYEEALRLLEAGYALEPHPLFLLEKAKVFGSTGRRPEAIALYESVVAQGDLVEANFRAASMRQHAVLLIDEGDLDSAETLLRASLALDPESSVAANELKYIAHLRSGGHQVAVQSTMSGGNEKAGKCSSCGRTQEELTVLDREGLQVLICERCRRKVDKRWWEFWK
jgi:tetratricopeptide (TPR) repeat protein